jgi:uncharacterized membrane protein YqiK
MNELLGSTFIFLLGFSICIVLFLALRMLFLWYWRVDTIVENQEIQIRLLKKLLEESRTIKPGTEVEMKP